VRDEISELAAASESDVRSAGVGVRSDSALYGRARTNERHRFLIRCRREKLLMHGKLEAADEESVHMQLEELARLSQSSKNSLFLSRAERGHRIAIDGAHT